MDANVLIDAHTLYYGIRTVPEFWAWLAHRGGSGDLKIPLENYEEVREGSTDKERDLLFAWIKDEANKMPYFSTTKQIPLLSTAFSGKVMLQTWLMMKLNRSVEIHS